MTGLTAILRKEVKNLFNSGWGGFLINVLIAVVWSFMLLIQHFTVLGGVTGVWLVFFAVIVAANFSGTVFISERVSGTLEVLIVSGVTRDAVLFGKVIFVVAATIAMGVVCLAISAVWEVLISVAVGEQVESLWDFAVWSYHISQMYVGAAVMNVSASAYLSVRMSNPRFLHFANLFITGALMTLYELVVVFASGEQYRIALVLVFLALGAVFLALARREFAGERITRPVIF
jgi:ABC-type transport system involved in multi-copper enzyme maturation permease subunit